MLSDRIQRIGFSPTLRIADTAHKMRVEGIDVIDLSVGEPDFPTPENVKQAGQKAIDANITKYTPNDGLPTLKAAIIRRIYEDQNITYEPDEIIVSSGAKNCLYNLCMALFNEGEEALIPVPYWVSYPSMIEMAKAVPIFVPTKEEDGFRLTPTALKAAITCNTKALILNNPCNPSGAFYPKDQLAELVKIALEENLKIIADEIYEKLVYDGLKLTSVAALSQAARENSIIINGVSKAYAMTGWRIGYAAGPKEIIAGMSKVQSHNTSNAASVSQMAALEALRGPQTSVSMMLAEFQKRRNYLLYRLRQLPKITCFESQGAFYLFPNFSAYYEMAFQGNPLRNSYGMAYYLLKHAQVALVPGAAFGANNFIRFSYAAAMETIEKAMDHVEKALEQLQPIKTKSRKPLNNTLTKVRQFVPATTTLSLEMREALVAESEAFLTYDTYYEWNANIAGVILQLRTNSPHLYDFWIENWYPAQLETDLEPHGIIYAVNWIQGREPHLFYHSESRTAFFFKSAFYPQLHHLALGMVTDMTERLYDWHTINAASVDFNGQSLLLMAPPGTGKSTHLAALLKQQSARLNAFETVFVRYLPQEAIAETAERKFLLPTDFGEKYPALIPLFDRSKCENVVVDKNECTNEPCRREDNCRLDRGSAYCFAASKISRVMLDPYWIGGPEKHVKRTKVKWVVILCKNPLSPPITKLPPEAALRYLEEGRGQTSSGGIVNQPFFNPEPLVTSADRLALQKRYFQKLTQVADFYLVNISTESVSEIQNRLRSLVAGDSEQALK